MFFNYTYPMPPWLIINATGLPPLAYVPPLGGAWLWSSEERSFTEHRLESLGLTHSPSRESRCQQSSHY